MRLLVKEDPELGYAYFCPACKRFLCGSADYCIFCGQPLDWEAEKIPYNGRVKWPTTEELEMAYHCKPEGGVVRGTEKKIPAQPTAGLAVKSLAQVAAEAKALGLTYGQYTTLVNTGTLERWRRNREAINQNDTQNRR